MSQHTFFHPTWGWFELSGNASTGLDSLSFLGQSGEPKASDDPLLLEAEVRIHRYLDGYPEDFKGLLLNPQGTPFQQRVWQALQQIPYGDTRSYAWLAQQLGYPKAGHASRAIGQANGKNPLPLVIPCHRVIQQNGQLGGYSAPGGVHTKAMLLQLEKQPVLAAV